MINGESVIEIGPGLGILTDLIAACPLAKLTLIELDRQLAAALETRFHADPRVSIIEQDFLRVDLEQLAASAAKLVIIGNLPFNVATAILERLCHFQAYISRMVLMFQREVAERIRAEPSTRAYNALSVFTALYWEIIDHFRVAAGSFHPRPKVDAEVLVLIPRATPLFADAEETSVLDTVRASFSAPRKTLRNSLAGGLGIMSEAAEAALLQSGIDPLRRPGTLPPSDFVRLARTLCATIPSIESSDA